MPPLGIPWISEHRRAAGNVRRRYELELGQRVLWIREDRSLDVILGQPNACSPAAVEPGCTEAVVEVGHAGVHIPRDRVEALAVAGVEASEWHLVPAVHTERRRQWFDAEISEDDERSIALLRGHVALGHESADG